MNQKARRNARLGMAALITATLALVVLVAQLGTAPLDRTSKKLDALENRWAPSTLALLELRAQLAELRAYELAQVSHADEPGALADYDTRIAQALKQARQALADYEATNPPASQAAMVQDVKERMQRYLAVHEQVEQALHDGRKDTADQLALEQAAPLRRELFASIVALTEDTYRLTPGLVMARR